MEKEKMIQDAGLIGHAKYTLERKTADGVERVEVEFHCNPRRYGIEPEELFDYTRNFARRFADHAFAPPPNFGRQPPIPRSALSPEDREIVERLYPLPTDPGAAGPPLEEPAPEPEPATPQPQEP